MSGSDSDSSSSSLPSRVVQPPSRNEGKIKAKSIEHGRNEGVDPNWAYKPPEGFTVVQNLDNDAGVFDWDTVKKDDDLEVWLIRVPNDIKPRHLENLSIHPPPNAKKTMRSGTLDRKGTTYDIWSVGENDDTEPGMGGEELRSLTCLLPRASKDGNFYAAPKPVARHIMVSPPPVTIKPSSPNQSTVVAPYSRPPRENYPKEMLNHRFMPYGSLAPETGGNENEKDQMVVDEVMEVDEVQVTLSPSRKKSHKSRQIEPPDVEMKTPKRKKRKGEVGEHEKTKKSKKVKT